MALLVSGLIFIIIVIMVLVVSNLLAEKRETIEKRLIRYSGEGKKISIYDAQMEESFFRRVVVPIFLQISERVASLTPQVWKDQLDKRLFQAGVKMTAEQFIMVQIILMVGFPLLMIFLCLNAGLMKAIFIGIITMLIGLIIPEYYLRGRIRERALTLQENLPDLLDLLTVSVEAGLGFDAALSRVVERSEGLLALEFKRLLQDIRMGKPRLDAFRDLSKRSLSSDLTTFCSAIVQADQLGVGIGKVLRIQSEQMRTKRRQRAEEAAMKAPIKMLFPMILLIFPALFIILLGPAVIRLINVFGGM